LNGLKSGRDNKVERLRHNTRGAERGGVYVGAANEFGTFWA
jgi:hypothetical protein